MRTVPTKYGDTVEISGGPGPLRLAKNIRQELSVPVGIGGPGSGDTPLPGLLIKRDNQSALLANRQIPCYSNITEADLWTDYNDIWPIPISPGVYKKTAITIWPDADITTAVICHADGNPVFVMTPGELHVFGIDPGLMYVRVFGDEWGLYYWQFWGLT